MQSSARKKYGVNKSSENGQKGKKKFSFIDQNFSQLMYQRKSHQFDHTQQPSINMPSMSNYAIFDPLINIKTTVKSRENSQRDQQPRSTSYRNETNRTHIQVPITECLKQQPLTSKAQTKRAIPSQLRENYYNVNAVLPKTETNKSSSRNKVNNFVMNTNSGVSFDITKGNRYCQHIQQAELINPFPYPHFNVIQSVKNNKHTKTSSGSYTRRRVTEEKNYFQKPLMQRGNQSTEISSQERVLQNKIINSMQSSRRINTNSSVPINTEPLLNQWENQKLPIKPSEALKNYGDFLSEFEKKEIVQYMNIFYMGHKTSKKTSAQPSDNEKGEYKFEKYDHIAYRYEILDLLGKGSFGCVLKVFDHKRNEESALKIIRSKKKFFNQALIELKILKYIKDNDPENKTNLVKIKDFVIFRNHVCIVFELLSINLYDFLRKNNFQGLPLELIRRFAIQILQSLAFLENSNIVHCDLKPENILLKNIKKSGLKIIDFGSSCFENERMYTYIQSRFYRSPEVIFGLAYGMPIDMWSFGCIMAELLIGFPLFAGENEQEQIQMFMEILNVPNTQFIEKCPRKSIFFDKKCQPFLTPNTKGQIRTPGSKSLNFYLKCDDKNFIDFVKRCLTWDQSERLKPAEALVHKWILDGLPNEIKLQHLLQMQSQSPYLQLDHLIKQAQQNEVLVALEDYNSNIPVFTKTQPIESKQNIQNYVTKQKGSPKVGIVKQSPNSPNYKSKVINQISKSIIV